MTKNLLDAVIDKAKELDWSCQIYDDCIEFERSSPAGEDFIFSITDKENAVQAVAEYATYFDADEHAIMWLENRDTVRGVPHNVRVLIDDADEIQKMLYELADALKEVEKNFRGSS